MLAELMARKRKKIMANAPSGSFLCSLILSLQVWRIENICATGKSRTRIFFKLYPI